jgi:hypothetical protein
MKSNLTVVMLVVILKCYQYNQVKQQCFVSFMKFCYYSNVWSEIHNKFHLLTLYS